MNDRKSVDSRRCKHRRDLKEVGVYCLKKDNWIYTSLCLKCKNWSDSI